MIETAQIELDFSERARRADPVTSHQAAARLGEFAHEHHSLILGSLVVHGDGTIYEIAERIGKLDHVQVARRLPELEAAGMVEPTVEKRASPKGRPCRVWRAKR